MLESNLKLKLKFYESLHDKEDVVVLILNVQRRIKAMNTKEYVKNKPR